VAKNFQEKVAWIMLVTTAPKEFLRLCTGTAVKINMSGISAHLRTKPIVSEEVRFDQLSVRHGEHAFLK
jgi:hypothetical protein